MMIKVHYLGILLQLPNMSTETNKISKLALLKDGNKE